MSDEFDQIDLGERKLRYVCKGEGRPTVVVDQGLGLSIERGFERPAAIGWAKVFAEVQNSTRVLMHDRAGLGSSDPPPAPRGCIEMVDDLRSVLHKANIPPPYLLVGHSIGGFNVRVFAKQYPQEIAGMVLVDSSHPDQHAKLVAALASEPESADTPAMRILRRGPDPTRSPEAIDLRACAQQA